MMNYSQLQDLQMSLQSFGNGQDSLKTLGTSSPGTSSRSPPGLPTSPVHLGCTPNPILDPNIQLDGLGTFASMPMNHPLRHQMDEVLGSQSLLLARYAALISGTNNTNQDCAIQSTPPTFTSSCVSALGTNHASPQNVDRRSCCSLTTTLPQYQDVNFLGRMLLLLSSGQQQATPPSSAFTSDMQQGRFSPPRCMLGTNNKKNETVMEREPPFPEKLHRLLRDVETLGRSDVISFVADDTFRIHDPVIFFHDVLPQYFRQTKLSSFKRQLKLYGFELVSKGPTIGGYRHKFLSRKDPTLCREMKRVAIKSRQPSCDTHNDDTAPPRTSPKTST